MKLTQLEPHFIKLSERLEDVKVLRPGIDPLRGNWIDADFEENEEEVKYFCHVDTLAEADGITFLSPLDFVKNGGDVGTSWTMVFFAGRVLPSDVGLNSQKQPVRWTVTGTDFGNLTLSPSIKEECEGGWHGFVTNGEVTNA